LAAKEGHLAVCRLLLDAGVDVDSVRTGASPVHRGWSPLFFAAANDHLALVELLLDRGADRELSDGDGRLALHHAASPAVRAALRKPRRSRADELLAAAEAGDVEKVRECLGRRVR
jgi:ankyrin repeat protein